MLGWEIQIINNATGQEYGDWLTGARGIDWIERLVKNGIAEKFYAVACSYYLIKAKDLIPFLVPNPPGYKNPTTSGEGGYTASEWIENYVIDAKALQTCAPEELLKIQTYDAS